MFPKNVKLFRFLIIYFHALLIDFHSTVDLLMYLWNEALIYSNKRGVVPFFLNFQCCYEYNILEKIGT